MNKSEENKYLFGISYEYLHSDGKKEVLDPNKVIVRNLHDTQERKALRKSLQQLLYDFDRISNIIKATLSNSEKDEYREGKSDGYREAAHDLKLLMIKHQLFGDDDKSRN